MTKGLLIHNPKAGGNHPELLPTIQAALGELEIVTLDELDGMKSIIPLARQRGCHWVAVAGGDGTVESVAEAMAGHDLPLGIIPAGTYNNFALSLKIPIELEAACQVIADGRARPIDRGDVNGKTFFECVGAGLDAELYPLSEDIKSGRWSRWGDFFSRAFRYSPQEFTLTLDRPVCEALVPGTTTESRRVVRRLRRLSSTTITIKALMITVSNGPYFGMNFAIAPDQKMDDGHLTVSIFSRYNKLRLWAHFFAIAFLRDNFCPRAVTLRVKTVQVTGPRRQAAHRDGTPDDNLWPLDISCRPKVLSVFQPD